MIEILLGSKVLATAQETGKWRWVKEEQAPDGFRMLVAESELLYVSGGTGAEGVLYTAVQPVKRETKLWLERVLESLWVWGLRQRKRSEKDAKKETEETNLPGS